MKPAPPVIKYLNSLLVKIKKILITLTDQIKIFKFGFKKNNKNKFETKCDNVFGNNNWFFNERFY